MVTVAVVLWFGAVIGCGGSGGGGAAGAGGGGTGTGGAGGTGGSASTSNGSGVDGTKLVSGLTNTEKGKECDWFASLVGGYGKTSMCGQGSFMPPMSQADCIQQFAMCDAKVSDFEACTKATVDAQKTCTDAAFATAIAMPACMAVGDAGC
jgi:hypothetical protein